MAHITAAEAAVNALVTFLAAEMPAKLDALDASYADGVVLADIAFWSKNPIIESDQWPFAEVFCGDLQVLHESGSDINLAQAIGVAINVREDTSNQLLRTRLYRYGVAMLELIRDWRAVGASAYTVNYLSPAVEFSPIVRNRSKIIGDVMVNLQLVKPEVYP